MSPDYYATFNRDNVTLVNINENPIVGLTEGGIKTRDQEYEFDLIVFALVFDASTGALRAANVTDGKGRGPECPDLD